MLNATGFKIFHSDFIYSLLSIMMILSLFMVKVGMKDVIKEKQATNTNNDVTAWHVIKQAWKLLLTEPLIALGITGSVI